MKPLDPRKDEYINDLSTVKPLYPGAFPQPDAEEIDAPYPEAPLNLTLGFDLETFEIPPEELMLSKKVPDGMMTTRKFKQIVPSIREIGLIERLSVIKSDPDAAGFLLHRAIDKGVSKERLARAFNVNLSTINNPINLLHGICPKAAELLQGHQFTSYVTQHLCKLEDARQIEAVELMITSKTLSPPPMRTPC